MTQGRTIVESVVDADTANAAMPKMKKIAHALTSELEINTAWNARIKEKSLFYDKVLKKYTPAPPADSKGMEQTGGAE